MNANESSDAAARYCLWSKASGDAALSSSVTIAHRLCVEGCIHTIKANTVACVNKRQLMSRLSFHHWIFTCEQQQQSLCRVQWEKEAPGDQWMGGRSLLQRWADFVQNRQAQAQSWLFIGLHQDVEPDAREKEKKVGEGKH